MDNASENIKGFLALAVILAIWWGWNSNKLSNFPDNPDTADISFHLYIFSRSAVSSHLRNSSSASYTTKDSWDYSKIKPNVYGAFGRVRAENGFGGMVMSKIYTVFSFDSEEDELTLEALRLNDEWLVDYYYAPFGKARPK